MTFGRKQLEAELQRVALKASGGAGTLGQEDPGQPPPGPDAGAPTDPAEAEARLKALLVAEAVEGLTQSASAALEARLRADPRLAAAP